MTARSTLALGVFAWLALGSVSHASPGSWADGGQWSWWSTPQLNGQSGSAGSATFDGLLSSLATSYQSQVNTNTPAPTQGGNLPPTPNYTAPTTDSSLSTPTAPAITASVVSAPAPSLSVSSSSSPGGGPDAFLNFGTAPYAEASTLTSGAAQPWYTSPVVQKLFNGTPDAQQQQNFAQAVLRDVQQTFHLSGLSPTLTLDPNAHANHMMSEVSGASYSGSPNAIGITDVGGNGFGFIDKLSYAQSIDQLEWAVAHNLSHELMHAFGVAVHHDQTGAYLDAATASWSLLADPNAALSSAAAQDIIGHNYGRDAGPGGTFGGQGIDGDEMISGPQPVPEPATIGLWLVAGAALFVSRKGLRLRRAA